MGASTKIEWTDATWPVAKGCDYMSPGCSNCYAADLIYRHSQHPNQKISLPLAGLTEKRGGRPRWTGRVYLNEPHLRDPIDWVKPKRIFVPSHGDLFHEAVPFEFIDRVFAVMAICRQHTFQVLTKRVQRAREYFDSGRGPDNGMGWHFSDASRRVMKLARELAESQRAKGVDGGKHWSANDPNGIWPLLNVWFGTSIEDQQRADERIPELLNIPASLLFLSCEPLLGPIKFGKVPGFNRIGLDLSRFWTIVGGESGPHARPCNIEWIRDIVHQHKAAGVKVFVKQLGKHVQANSCQCGHNSSGQWKGPSVCFNCDGFMSLRDPKGGDWDEWPEDLRVREVPS